MATLFWKLSDRETRLEQNITHILKAKPSLEPLFENVASDISTHFFEYFFPIYANSVLCRKFVFTG